MDDFMATSDLNCLIINILQIIAMENGHIRTQGSLTEIERKDPELFQAWKSSVKRELESNEDWTDGKARTEGNFKKSLKATDVREAVGNKTAKERWQLVRLVSRISSQLRQNIISDGTWQTEEEAHVVCCTNVQEIPVALNISEASNGII